MGRQRFLIEKSSIKDWSIKLDKLCGLIELLVKLLVLFIHFSWLMGKHFTFCGVATQRIFDYKTTREKRKLHFQEPGEMRLNAYNSLKLYKERTKIYHDKMILKINFHIGQFMLLFNYRWRFFPRKLKSK